MRQVRGWETGRGLHSAEQGVSASRSLGSSDISFLLFYLTFLISGVHFQEDFDGIH